MNIRSPRRGGALRIYYTYPPAYVRERFAEVALALGLDDDDPRLFVVLLLICRSSTVPSAWTGCAASRTAWT